MTTTQNNHIESSNTSLTVARRFVEEVLNEGRFEVLGDIVHPEYRYEGPDGSRLKGLGDLELLVAGYRSAFSDFHASITSEVASGDLVALTMTLTGTHDGEFDGLPPTGLPLALPIAIFTRVEDDRIIEDREFFDTTTMLAQLGIEPGANEVAG
ncbi:MAG: ester cyclase [Microthrixaceae bacterium]